MSKESKIDTEGIEGSEPRIFDILTSGEDSEEIFKQIQTMYNGLDTITDITVKERLLLLRLDTVRRMEEILRKKLDIKSESPISISDISEKFKTLSISLKRQSRKEFFEIFNPITKIITKSRWKK